MALQGADCRRAARGRCRETAGHQGASANSEVDGHSSWQLAFYIARAPSDHARQADEGERGPESLLA